MRENLEKTQGLSTKNSGFGIWSNAVALHKKKPGYRYQEEAASPSLTSSSVFFPPAAQWAKGRPEGQNFQCLKSDKELT